MVVVGHHAIRATVVLDTRTVALDSGLAYIWLNLARIDYFDHVLTKNAIKSMTYDHSRL